MVQVWFNLPGFSRVVVKPGFTIGIHDQDIPWYTLLFYESGKPGFNQAFEKLNEQGLSLMCKKPA